ncbi:hypothetical protein [Methylobacterium thuringiense]|uniref:Uncharacterized protein n=1 Tax=Methylobacterium thuringiense TaxID=1003091 RepID=A0ABQ4TH32_9HYPH|nr:hypothetical protein [Methylobacterium thuringiense]GJE54601.1 hypothetical protein EKPJFOCH_1079 [Methylobacterium thuringiense]
MPASEDNIKPLEDLINRSDAPYCGINYANTPIKRALMEQALAQAMALQAGQSGTLPVPDLPMPDPNRKAT